MLDSFGLAILFNLTWTEIQGPQMKPFDLAKMQDQGQLALPTDAFIDAKSVRDAIAADPIKVPSDKATYIHVLAARDLVDRNLCSRVIWIDTNDQRHANRWYDEGEH